MAARTQRYKGGARGGWIVTFADLMSLLMCFFVLLLSFAELDLLKFKAVAGSIRLAFGVQREIPAPEIPKGTSIIAQEFSPGSPMPTPLDEVRQRTIDEDKQTLEFTDALTDDKQVKGPDHGTTDAGTANAQAEAEKIVQGLREEISKGLVQVETVGPSIIIRILEQGSFPSGTAVFDADFLPVIAKLRRVLTGIQGMIMVAGHTDDQPIKTPVYRSNWDLSAARAVSVVHELLVDGGMDPSRFVVEGHADAHPIAPNDSMENRALNRRVELTIETGSAHAAASPEPPAGLSVEDAAGFDAQQDRGAGADNTTEAPGTAVPDG